VRRFVRRMFMLSVVAGTAYAIWRWFESQRSDTGLSWEAQPAPFPPQPRTENPPPAASNPSPAEPVTATEPAAAREGAPSKARYELPDDVAKRTHAAANEMLDAHPLYPGLELS